LHDLLEAAWVKADRAAGLYLHSAGKLGPFDPTKPYSPDELEPYDALVTRFERAIEVFLKFFRTVESFETAETGSTVRDQGIYRLLIDSYRPVITGAVAAARRYVAASRSR
jgi:hypothetical protein